EYNAKHKGVQRAFEVTPAVLQEFQDFLTARKLKWAPAEIEQFEDRLRGEIKEAVVAGLFGLEEAYKVHAEIDRQLQKALDLFPQAQNLASLPEQKAPVSR
ncbi:MAG TPA: hypothetical protein VKF61_09205, partial [Candidatus Polarisedimenticolia bacterium]|nr:hypothetical protein [Candidatus Polarisedimenticolia bacterium]